MGAGSHRAGIGPAGASPITSNLSLPNQGQRAALFDPLSKTFPLGDDGKHIDVHPVDQAMALALCLTAGSIKSAPKTGHTLRQIKRAEGDTVQREAEDRVRLATADLVARGDVELLKITVASDPIPNGRLLVDVSYRNLRLSRTDPQTVRAAV